MFHLVIRNDCDWNEDLRFAKIANPLWKKYLCEKFDTDNVVSIEDNISQQFLGVGDFIVDTVLKIEVKTRKEWVYNCFKNDVALETNANVEWNRTGSAFLNCKADLFGYGFLTYNDSKLTDPQLYVLPTLQEWFRDNKDKYPDRKTRMNNGKYHTTFKAIPKSHISKFRFKFLDELFS